MKTKIIEKLQEYTYFIWLILLIFIAVFVTYFYDTNKKNQTYLLQKSFNNIYLKKSINALTSKLKAPFSRKSTFRKAKLNLPSPIVEIC